MEYEAGDKVVIPGCGVGDVRGVMGFPLEGETVETYEIEMRGDLGRVWIPLDRVAEQRVRPVMDPERIEETWTIIAEQEAPKRRQHWNQRRRRYTEMLMSNHIRSVAALLGELSAVREEKTLSFTEKRMFRRAWKLLTAEVAAAREVSPEEASEELADIIEAPNQL